VGPLLSLAESVALQIQDRAEFESLLQQALAIDPDTVPKWRLVNLILQERARWRLAHIDELFLSAKPE
jgi:predicted anti-sigma-YlaC factor YlaD